MGSSLTLLTLSAMMYSYGHALPSADPVQAVYWWRHALAATQRRHETAAYHLGIAYATGRGVSTPSPRRAAALWRRIANGGHAGAANRLGELLWENSSSNSSEQQQPEIRQDRAEALEWLVTAAEMGHGLARRSVLTILQQEHPDVERASSCSSNETSPPNRKINMERRYSIGGDPRAV